MKAKKSNLNLALEIKGTCGLIESLDGIAKHGPGHGMIVLCQEILQDCDFAFACFSQHPTDRFVDEIMFVFNEQFGNRQGVLEIILSYELVGCHDRYSLTPEMFGAGKLIELRSWTIHQEGTNNFVSR